MSYGSLARQTSTTAVASSIRIRVERESWSDDSVSSYMYPATMVPYRSVDTAGCTVLWAVPVENCAECAGATLRQ